VSGTLFIGFDTDRASDATTIRGTLDHRPLDLMTGRAWSA
jgi:hypothetical protein